MLQRTITGAMIFVITLAFVLLKMVHALFFDAFVLMIVYAALYETIGAYKNAEKKPYRVALYAIPALICLVFNLETSISHSLIYVLLMAVAVLVYSLTADIIGFAQKRKKGIVEQDINVLNSTLFERTKITMQIVAYPLIPLAFMFALNHLPYEIGYIGIILIFVVSMLTDTCAYFVGMLFGKTKFIPEVSPKKTVAGVVGGLLGGVIGALGCFFLFYYTDMFTALNIAGMGKSIAAMLIIAIGGSYINQLGDLIASALKRKIGIKDFSHIFPGHGGFMDRVDGMMFVSTFIYIILVLFFV